MYELKLGLIAALTFMAIPAAAQLPSPSPAAPAIEPTGLPPPTAGGAQNGAATASPPAAAPGDLPPPSADMSGAQGGGQQSSAAAGGDWKFSWNGYFRAPLRIGVGSRPACPAGVSPATQAQKDLTNYQMALGAANMGGGNSPYNGVYCAAPGQSRTSLHSPYIPDDQYLSWNNTRQWEQAWAEVFLSYGNDRIKGTVGLQGYDFTDTSLLGNQASPAQFGFGQAWIRVTPNVPIEGANLVWKVGAFWEKFGMAGRYDGGPYDTYMFGRTHQLGGSLAGQYQAGDLTFKLEHGFGAHLEMVPAGISLSGSQLSLNYLNSGAANNYPPGASPGFTLLHHVHAGVSYKRKLDFNVHYMVAWSQDDRVEGTLGSSPTGGAANTVDRSPQPDGSITVLGAEARLSAGRFGDLYLAYSHIDAKNVTAVGPAIEVMHSSGGGGHNAGNGIYENFFNSVGDGTGTIDSVQLYYNGRMNIGPVDVKLGLFGMYSTVSGTDATSVNLLTGIATSGTQKLKYGADLTANVLPWLGVGVRGDFVQPDSHDSNEAFGVVSPKLVIRTDYVTHEEITFQYSHYWDGTDVLPQQWLALVGAKNIATAAAHATAGGYTNFAGPPYPNDTNVFGAKVTMWW
jgi:hypothetical protein